MIDLLAGSHVRARESIGLKTDVQLKTSSRYDQHGADISTLPAFSALRARGLMILALFSAEVDPVRQCFVRLRGLRDQLRQDAPAGIDLDELSMGMSGDYEMAVEVAPPSCVWGR